MQSRFYALLILVGLACSENEPVRLETDPGPEEVITIPVVVHVLYSTEAYNISEAKIQSQIEVLNLDFRAMNSDITQVPEEFKPLIADTGIEFQLASRDPEGNLTNGITRTYTTVDGWQGRDILDATKPEDFALYSTEKGGITPWDTRRYLNIYVVEMSDRTGRMGLPGYAHFPGTDARIDCVVIDPRAFGTIAPLEPGHALGRTATHEIGHWLNLLHIFGDESGCATSDFVDDTPTTSTRYLGHPQYPQYSCGNSSLFMNFMDYVNDDAMYMFTRGQRSRMRAVFMSDSARYHLYQNSLSSI